MSKMLAAALAAPIGFFLEGLLDLARDHTSLEIEKSGMPATAPYASSGEGGPASCHFQARLMVPSSMLAVLFDPRIAHP
jgi:hypothetical protein